MDKEGFIYIWYDRKRKMYYLGSHWGTENDGYICSSDRMRDAYRRRPKDFRRKIIQRKIPRDMLLEEEHKWLQLISDDEIGNKYYNLRKHKWGHWATDHEQSLPVREKISKKMKGKKQTPTAIKNRFASRSGYTHPEETRQKISNALIGHKFGMNGKKHSDDTRKNISEAIKKWHEVKRNQMKESES